MPKIRKRLAIALARNFASGLIESSEVLMQEGTGLTGEELAEAQNEIMRIAKRIDATVNRDLLSELK